MRYEGPVRIPHRDLRRHDYFPLAVGLGAEVLVSDNEEDH